MNAGVRSPATCREWATECCPRGCKAYLLLWVWRLLLTSCHLPLLHRLELCHLRRIDLHVAHHLHASWHVTVHLLRHHLSLLLLQCLEALLLHVLLCGCI